MTETSTTSKSTQADVRRRKPEWLRVRMPTGQSYQNVRKLMRGKMLHTVCEEANCPNIGECWGHGTATFLLLGDTCTRNCRFCNVHSGRPDLIDEEEPQRVADAVESMQLRHAVLTSVDRDDQPDGGAHIFARSIQLIHKQVPGCSVEVLIPDFKGDRDALAMVMEARPEVLNHNVETIPRLYPTVRPQAKYERSLRVLEMAKEIVPEVNTKSGLMVGLGETFDEVVQVMRDLRARNVDILTIGQYLRPGPENIAMDRYWHPDEFAGLRDRGLELGFLWVESGPLVRSSYHAGEQMEEIGGQETGNKE